MKTRVNIEAAFLEETKAPKASQNRPNRLGGKERRVASWALAVAAFAIMLANPFSASAGTVLQYTGRDFIGSPGTHLIINLTLISLIQPNTEYFFSDLASGSITDTNAFLIGYLGHSLSNLPLRTDLYFETDGAGNIDEWQIPDDTSITHEQNIGSYFVPGVINSDADQTGESRVAGTWECVSGCYSEAPEPSTWGLTLFGPALLWLVRRRVS